MRRRDREVVDPTRIEEIIAESAVLRLGLNDDGEVYVVPVNFGAEIIDGRRVFYFHSARSGRKLDVIRRNPRVGFELDAGFELVEGPTPCAFSARYRSVVGVAVATELADAAEKRRGLTAIMNQAAGGGRDGGRAWRFDDAQLDAVAVVRLDVERLSCKENR
ncbi:MAG: pyridoxamine 5'-phosphate oxidase family protein [Thermoguttaceae bacterium]|nr:pyridoxamine 5'-phosphate oxidase family protein [Thermoguttaceae bacterium]